MWSTGNSEETTVCAQNCLRFALWSVGPRSACPGLKRTTQLVYCSVYSFRQLTKPVRLMYRFYYKSLSKTVVGFLSNVLLFLFALKSWKVSLILIYVCVFQTQLCLNMFLLSCTRCLLQASHGLYPAQFES